MVRITRATDTAQPTAFLPKSPYLTYKLEHTFSPPP